MRVRLCKNRRACAEPKRKRDDVARRCQLVTYRRSKGRTDGLFYSEPFELASDGSHEFLFIALFRASRRRT